MVLRVRFWIRSSPSWGFEVDALVGLDLVLAGDRLPSDEDERGDGLV